MIGGEVEESIVTKYLYNRTRREKNNLHADKLQRRYMRKPSIDQEKIFREIVLPPSPPPPSPYPQDQMERPKAWLI